MNHHHHRLPDRSDYAKLASGPIGLLVAIAAMRPAAGPSMSTLAIDLMGLALGALIGWLGGEFVLARGPFVERRTRRDRPRHRLAHKAV